MMKNKSAGFYCNILAVILEILGIICFAVMAMDGEAAPATVYGWGVNTIRYFHHVLLKDFLKSQSCHQINDFKER